jgi:transketolase
MTMADTTAGRRRRSVVLSGTGSMVVQALAAAERLAADGIGSLVLNNATPNHPDVAGHAAALKRCGGRLVTIEEHQAVGGAGAMLRAALVDAGVRCTARTLGVRGGFGRSAYTAPQLYDHYGIGAAAIVDAVRSLF